MPNFNGKKVYPLNNGRGISNCIDAVKTTPVIWYGVQLGWATGSHNIKIRGTAKRTEKQQ